MWERNHGGPTQFTHPAEYRLWAAMRYACGSPQSRNFHLYGKRGVKVCDRWKESFQAFMEDVGAQPVPTAKLVRKKSDGDFCPENCEWRDFGGAKLQANTIMVPMGDGTEMPLKTAAAAHNVHPNTIKKRLRAGVPPEKLFSTERIAARPKKPGEERHGATRFVVYQGSTLTLKELAARTGISLHAIEWEYRKGSRGEALWGARKRRRRSRRGAQ